MSINSSYSRTKAELSISAHRDIKFDSRIANRNSSHNSKKTVDLISEDFQEYMKITPIASVYIDMPGNPIFCRKGISPKTEERKATLIDNWSSNGIPDFQFQSPQNYATKISINPPIQLHAILTSSPKIDPDCAISHSIELHQVTCPVCETLISTNHINEHLDSGCLHRRHLLKSNMLDTTPEVYLSSKVVADSVNVFGKPLSSPRLPLDDFLTHGEKRIDFQGVKLKKGRLILDNSSSPSLGSAKFKERNSKTPLISNFRRNVEFTPDTQETPLRQISFVSSPISSRSTTPFNSTRSTSLLERLQARNQPRAAPKIRNTPILPKVHPKGPIRSKKKRHPQKIPAFFEIEAELSSDCPVSEDESDVDEDESIHRFLDSQGAIELDTTFYLNSLLSPEQGGFGRQFRSIEKNQKHPVNRRPVLMTPLQNREDSDSEGSLVDFLAEDDEIEYEDTFKEPSPKQKTDNRREVCKSQSARNKDQSTKAKISLPRSAQWESTEIIPLDHNAKEKTDGYNPSKHSTNSEPWQNAKPNYHTKENSDNGDSDDFFDKDINLDELLDMSF